MQEETKKPKEKPTLLQRILAIMRDLSYIKKSDKKVGNQYTYVSHDSVTGALHPLLVKHGIVIFPSVKEIKQDGNRTIVTLTVTIFNVDNEMDFLSQDMVGFGIDTADKGPGKAISYAYKYALLKLFCLETGDDPDHDQNSQYVPPEVPPKVPDVFLDTMQAFALEEEIERYITPLDFEYRNRVLKTFGVTSFEEIKLKDLERIKKNIYSKRKTYSRNPTDNSPDGHA